MKLYGLIGYPLEHSFSKKYFEEKFHSENISDSKYKLFEIPSIDQFNTLLENNPELCGLTVTIPYKEKIIPYLDEVDPTARSIGAVNTVQFLENGKLKGFNTDIYGFRISLEPLLSKEHQKALILGTGGAAKAVKFVLDQLDIQTEFASRNPGNDQYGYNDLNKKVVEDHLLIINTTPLGTYPEIEACPDIPYEFVTSSHFFYDLVYNPPETLFLKKAKERGAQIKSGLEMLHKQAEKAWDTWNEKT